MLVVITLDAMNFSLHSHLIRAHPHRARQALKLPILTFGKIHFIHPKSS